MINHIRTLLLNQPSSAAVSDSFPGEEYVPPNFVPITLTPDLSKIRDILFGQRPDRAMLNYRLRQYMNLLHSDKFLNQYTVVLDPRITYLPFNDPLFVQPSRYNVSIKHIPVGTTRTLYINGDIDNVRDRSRLRKFWTVEILSEDSAKVISDTVPTSIETYSFSVEDGLTTSIPLTNSDLSVYADPTIGTKWFIEIFAQPEESLTDVVSKLNSLDNQSLSAIFGRRVEPFLSFYSLWTNEKIVGPSVRLGSIVLSYAFNLELLRLNRE